MHPDLSGRAGDEIGPEFQSLSPFVYLEALVNFMKKEEFCMRFYSIIGIFIFSCQLMISPVWSAEAPKTPKAPDIEPKAGEVLKQMCDYLKNLQQFSVQAEITEDVLLTSGQRIQYGRNVEASVRRPDRFRAESVGDTDNRQLIYDGKTITLMDRTKNFYTTIAAPPDIDAALEHATQAFNLRAPLADLIYTKAYEYLTEGALSGFYVGTEQGSGSTLPSPGFQTKGHRLADLGRRQPNPGATQVSHHR